jgi:hypothetical protein
LPPRTLLTTKPVSKSPVGKILFMKLNFRFHLYRVANKPVGKSFLIQLLQIRGQINQYAKQNKLLFCQYGLGPCNMLSNLEKNFFEHLFFESAKLLLI